MFRSGPPLSLFLKQAATGGLLSGSSLPGADANANGIPASVPTGTYQPQLPAAQPSGLLASGMQGGAEDMAAYTTKLPASPATGAAQGAGGNVAYGYARTRSIPPEGVMDAPEEQLYNALPRDPRQAYSALQAHVAKGELPSEVADRIWYRYRIQANTYPYISEADRGVPPGRRGVDSNELPQLNSGEYPLPFTQPGGRTAPGGYWSRR